jgi:SAM-dependent methyltransferase
MFFQDRIKSILKTDRVLEIGPGATPYFRSDVFLELNYEDESNRIAQSGHVGILKTDKPIIYYDGGVFPFQDKEFDYVICSHVLEHVPDASFFLNEIQRVGKKGYLEYPTIYYDYMYNFPEHQLFILENKGVVNWMTKEESGLMHYEKIQKFFYRTCELGYHEMIQSLKEYFFQGFEWFDTIKSRKVDDIEKVTYNVDTIVLEFNKPKIDPLSIETIYNQISLKRFLKYRIKKIFK